MCSMFGDEKFMALGYAFHNGGDGLGVALKSKDVNVSNQGVCSVQASRRVTRKKFESCSVNQGEAAAFYSCQFIEVLQCV